jgi:hypothetical protein
VIDNAEAITNWGGDTFVLYTDSVIQGTYAVGCAQTATGNNDVYVTGTWDFSSSTAGGGDQHIRLPFNITYIGNLAASNAIQVFLYDGSNTSYWYWDKWADYSGGWAQAIIYTGDTPDVDGSIDMAAITRIGLRFVTATKPRNQPYNALFDAWTYGDGFTVYGGTASDPITWADIAVADNVNAFWIVENVGGVMFLRGDVQIGDGTNATYFSPDGEIVMFQEEQVSSTLYNISFVDDSSALTDIDIIGGAWSCASTTLRFTITASDADVNSFSMDGVQISKAGKIYFHGGASVENCVFDDCGQIDPSTATFKYNFIKNYDDDTPSSGAVEAALLWPSDDSNCSDNEFADNTMSVEYGSGSDSTPVFSNMVFDDNSGWYDVLNTSGNSTTAIELTGTSNANSYIGDHTTFPSSYPLTLNVQDGDKQPVLNAQCSIHLLDSPYTELMNEDSATDGTAVDTYSGSTPVDIVWKVRKSETTDDPRYFSRSDTGQITTDGFTITVTLTENPYI